MKKYIIPEAKYDFLMDILHTARLRFSGGLYFPIEALLKGWLNAIRLFQRPYIKYGTGFALDRNQLAIKSVTVTARVYV